MRERENEAENGLKHQKGKDRDVSASTYGEINTLHIPLM